ncbi:MAG: hypothetical protein EVA27_02780 [Candidatus Actinomarinales bacterium]|nr:MAG: hypothetical protein EVA27_02780 [Candidatus Actinomarinales bacterium]
MKKHFLIFLILIIGCSNSIEEATTVQDTTTTTVQDTTTTTVQDTTTTTVQDTTSEVDECSKKTSPDKCHYVAVGYDKPQNEFAQEIVVATDVPQTIVDEYYEIQNMLNSIIGSYNRYVTVITTTNEFSQPIFDKLTEIHWDQELNIVDGYLIGAGCLTGSGDWQVFPPDPYALCVMDYEFVEYPHDTREWNTPLPQRRAVLYHGWAHEYFHRYQRAYHYELNMGNLDSIDTPVWWIEGAAILFPNIWLNQSWQEIELFKDLSFQEIQEAEGINLDLWYKSARKAAQGESYPDDRCNNYMMNSLDSSYDTSAFCFIGIANAYLAYLTSYETVWVDIPKDIYELSFQGSFEKHTNMTLEEFYDKFNSFMREGNSDDPPPLGFFPEKPISEIVDFFKYSDF